MVAASGGLAWAGKKLLGPLLDDIAEGWRQRHEEYRRQNFDRILEKAARKAGNAILSDGAVPPRVAAHVFDEGSWCEDEVMAEYLGGILAASRSNDQRDDRGSTWAGLVTRLSTFEIRSHYLIYECLRRGLAGQQVNLRRRKELRQAGLVWFSTKEYCDAMQLDDPEYALSVLGHSFFGLAREQLIGNEWGAATPSALKDEGLLPTSADVPNEEGVVVRASAPGIELYLWGHGRGMGLLDVFVDPEEQFAFDSSVTVPTNALVLRDHEGANLRFLRRAESDSKLDRIVDNFSVWPLLEQDDSVVIDRLGEIEAASVLSDGKIAVTLRLDPSKASPEILQMLRRLE